MLEESLKWRATYKPEEIRWVINCTMKNFIIMQIHKTNYALPCSSSFLILPLKEYLHGSLTDYGNHFYHLQHEVAHEGETGKVSRANFHDRLGRTVLIMRPGMQVYFQVFCLSC